MIRFTNFIINNTISLPAVFQLLLRAMLAGLVLALLAHNLVALLAEHLAVSLLTDLSWQILAVRFIHKVLELLRLGLGIDNALLDGLSAALLLPDRVGLEETQILTHLLDSWPAFLLNDSPGQVFALLGGPLPALLLASLDAHSLFAVKFYREAAAPICDELLLIVAVAFLHFDTVSLLSLSNFDVIYCVTHRGRFSVASFFIEGFSYKLLVNLLNEIAVNISNFETLGVRNTISDHSAVWKDNIPALLHDFSQTSFLDVRFANIFSHNAFNLLADWSMTVSIMPLFRVSMTESSMPMSRITMTESIMPRVSMTEIFCTVSTIHMTIKSMIYSTDIVCTMINYMIPTEVGYIQTKHQR